MEWLRIETRDGANAFLPGETVEGTVGWHFDAPARSVDAAYVPFLLSGHQTDRPARAPSAAHSRDNFAPFPSQPSKAAMLKTIIVSASSVVEILIFGKIHIK